VSSLSASEWIAIGTFAVTTILAILTGIYVFLTYKLAQAPQKQINAQVLLALRDEFSSREMLDGMRTLARWKLNHGSDFAKVFGQLRKQDYDQVRDVDLARREFKGYFLKLRFLLKSELANERFVKMLQSASSVGLLLNVVEPLEAVINEKYNRAVFDLFRQMYSDELAREEGELLEEPGTSQPTSSV